MCDCSCDYDPPSVLSEKHHKARKPWQCSECDRPIAIGETYLKIWGVWDGRPDTFRWCAHCEAGHQVVVATVECHCYAYGGIWENLIEDCWATKSFALYRILLGERRKWTIRRGPRKGQLMPVPKVPITACPPERRDDPA